MRLADARIGYAGYSPDFAHPGDRRRFSAYAEMRGLSYERAAIDRDYDLVLVTHSSDLSGWTRRKRREGDQLKLVFELVDSYFTQTNRVRRLLKGVTRYAMGLESRPSLDFRKQLIGTCRIADAVICSTPEQREIIRQFNPNVFISFDHFDADLSPPKEDYRRGPRLKLVWEGQAVTLPNLMWLAPVLNGFRNDIELYIVTDPYWRRWVISGQGTPVLEKLKQIECPLFFEAWSRQTFSHRIVESDLGIIPIDAQDPMARGKPENKLVLLWKLGMPVLTASTPAYDRAMTAAGLDMTCSGPEEWRDKLAEVIASSADRLRDLGTRGRAHAERAYSADEFAGRFDRAFAAVGFQP